ncbi:MAG: hypothetical protein SNJ62_08435 [Chloracidobacterium sp.]|uniref:Transmembrane protein n=1 Tax=Chloracidobacterium validum TaxID=2821543 RepID=A0ABX8B5K1_9BACT|nr:hypothetical protein [Chloracidobacterium validum]QUW02208.1 hypothetical protein J8C06_07495 [Chloracidobacterium validum]
MSPIDELVRLEGRAFLGLALGIAAALVGWLCTLPLGVFALFFAIQAEAGRLRFEERAELPEGYRLRLVTLRRRVRWALALGGIGTVLFLVSLVRFLWLYLSSH